MFASLEEHVLLRQRPIDPTAPEDENKYSKAAKRRDRWGNRQRIVAALLIGISIVIVAGDGIFLHYSRSGKGGYVGRAHNMRIAYAHEGHGAAAHTSPTPASTGPFLSDWEQSASEAKLPIVPDAVPAPASPSATPSGARRLPSTLPAAGGASAAAAAAVSAAAAAVPVSASAAPTILEEPVIDWSRVSADECTAYFGPGFTQHYSVFTNLVGGEALYCKRNPSIDAVACGARNLLMDPSAIHMSRGGEPLDSVMGRKEEEELPQFRTGAFELLVGGGLDSPDDDRALKDNAFLKVAASPGEATLARAGDASGSIGKALIASGGELDVTLSRSHVYTHAALTHTEVVQLGHVGGLATSPANTRGVVQVAGSRFPVLLTTRMEYANLFHTSTDWYNVWAAARLAGLVPTDSYDPSELQGLTLEAAAAEAASPRPRTPRIPAHVLFLDGHNDSPMDSGWRGAFLSVNYAKHFPGPVLFRSAVFAPFGYKAAISEGIQVHQRTCWAAAPVRQFGLDFVRAFGLTPRASADCSGPKPRVLFVRRVHYVAHPRHNGQIVRRLDNEDAIFDYLRDKAAQPDAAFTLVNGLFSGMTVPEQVALIQDACVIMGAHGAGLSHVLFAPQGAHMLELRPPAFQRPHFIAYAQWAGVTHHDWALFTSAPEPAEVLTRLQRVLDIAAGRRSFDAVGDGDAPPLNPGDVPPFPVTTVEMPERQKALRGLP